MSRHPFQNYLYRIYTKLFGNFIFLCGSVENDPVWTYIV